MINQELAKIFFGIASYLKSEDIPFKPYAYERVARTLDTLEDTVAEIYSKGGVKALEGIPGVGKNIALRIEEYLKTGNIKYYEELKKKLPVDLNEISAIQGMGPKKARVLYQKLGIKNLKDLERAAKKETIRDLPGFGQKTEKNILEGITFLKKSKGRFLLGDIMPVVEEILEKLKGLKEVQEINVAGSVRRMRETIGDVDILIVSKNPEKIMDFFVSLPGTVKVWGKGSTKSSIRTRDGFDIDLRVVPRKSYGAALQYFTGSKDHNIVTRKIAIEKGLKLSEYGVFRGKKMIAGKTEQEVYKAIGLPWIPPEIRTNTGEIEAGLAEKLPHLIGYDDIRGDLHTQTSWNGGVHSIEEMVQEAKSMGYEYLGISDHTKFLRIEKGLDEKQLLKQRRYIEKLKKKITGITILQGCESNILADGSIDIDDEVLSQLDYVIAGVHSQMKMPKEQMTSRIIKAMRNPHVDIIAHPTGRILQKRDEYQVDFEEILDVARETGTILEINAHPSRLDLNDYNIRRAKEAGVKMIIDTDAHKRDHLHLMKYGIAQARRGWAEKKDVVNTQPVKQLLTFFK